MWKVTQADTVIQDKQRLLATLEEEETKLKREIDKVFQLHFNDKISQDVFKQRHDPLQERREQIDQQIPELQGEIDFLKIQHLSSDEILNEAKDLSSRWPQLNQEEKRRIVETITEQIIVAEEDVTIRLCYLPPKSEMMATGQHNLRGSSPRRA